MKVRYFLIKKLKHSLLNALAVIAFAAMAATAYAATVTDGELPSQGGWKWDRKSHHLIFDSFGPISPAVGRPDLVGSYLYRLYYVPRGATYRGKGQAGWKWDRKSHNLIFDGAGAKSPAGGEPDFSESYNYVLYHAGQLPRSLGTHQLGWKWDRRSHNLIFDGDGAISADGRAPDFNDSWNYALEYTKEPPDFVVIDIRRTARRHLWVLVKNVGAPGRVTRTECSTLGSADANSETVELGRGDSRLIRSSVWPYTGRSARCAVRGVARDGSPEFNLTNNQLEKVPTF